MEASTGETRRSRDAPPLRGQLRSGAVWATLSQATTKTAFVFSALIGARLLGVRGFGEFAALQGTALVTVALADFGLSMYVERELASRRMTPLQARAAFRKRCQTSLPVIAVATFLALCFGSFNRGALVLAAAAAVAVSFSTLLNGMLQGLLAFRHSAVGLSFGRVIQLGLMVGALVCSWHSLAGIVGLYAISELATTVLLWKQWKRLLMTDASWREPQRLEQAHLGEPLVRSRYAALAYWGNSVSNIIYNRADATLVFLLAGATAAGNYAPGSAIQSAAMIAPGLVTAGLPNAGARAFADYGELALRHACVRAGLLAAGVGLGAAACVWFLAPLVLPLLFPNGYAAAVLPTRILACSLPFYGLELALLGYLVACGRALATTLGYGAALAVALAGNVLLTPTLGAVGAAYAALVREPLAVSTLLVAVIWPGLRSRGRTGGRRGAA